MTRGSFPGATGVPAVWNAHRLDPGELGAMGPWGLLDLLDPV